MNKEQRERKRRELMIAIDYLERSQKQEYSIKGYEKTADNIKELNKQLKELDKWSGFWLSLWVWHWVFAWGVVNPFAHINLLQK